MSGRNRKALTTLPPLTRAGRGTGGGYGWRLGKSLALGFVEPELAEVGTEFEIEVLGEMKPAVIVEDSPYDPKNERLRA